MRFAFVPFAMLAASFTLAAAPTATIDPSTNYFKIDVTRPPAPPTQVYVVNFPDVQGVAGTVSVDNFPAVQAVGGTVNVGNLPLDSDGALRVVNSPTPARSIVAVELLDAPIDACAGQPIERSVISDGYSLVGASVSPNSDVTFEIVWQLGDGEDFLPLGDIRNGLVTNSGSTDFGTPNTCQGFSSKRVVCRNVGGKVKVRITGFSGCPHTVASARIYLIP